MLLADTGAVVTLNSLISSSSDDIHSTTFDIFDL